MFRHKVSALGAAVLLMVACSSHHKPLGEFWTNVVNSSIEACANEGKPVPDMLYIRVLKGDEGYYLLFKGAWHKTSPPGVTRLYKLSTDGRIEREMAPTSYSVSDNDPSVLVNDKKCQIVQDFMRFAHSD